MGQDGAGVGTGREVSRMRPRLSLEPGEWRGHPETGAERSSRLELRVWCRPGVQGPPGCREVGIHEASRSPRSRTQKRSGLRTESGRHQHRDRKQTTEGKTAQRGERTESPHIRSW